MKSHAHIIALSFLLLLSSCTDNTPSLPSSFMQEIKGRDYEGTRFPVYRVRVPTSWVRKDSLPNESLKDTTKPICEFLILNGPETIRIAIHNFTSENMDHRIPPAAQIARWQHQFDFLSPSESHTSQQAFSGFTGLKFKGVGSLNHVATMMLGWSLQMGNEHYRMLRYPRKATDTNVYQEMRADVTIKAVGPVSFMEEKEEEITHFARSFELIEEIPSRS